MSEHPEDASLVLALRAGDEGAFTDLFTRWSDRCFDVARRILHDDGLAAEVTQETFTVAWQQIDQLRDAAAFGGWVLRTSRNKALNRLEQERRSVSTDDAHPVMANLVAAGSVEGDASAAEQEQMLWAAAAALGERDASVLDLHLRHGLSSAEIAEELDVTTNHANQLIFRMKDRLATGIRAWVLFRGGDASCPALRVELASAGVEAFGPDAVRVVGRHRKACDDCEQRQALVLAPEAMFAAVPVAIMAPALRSSVTAGLRGAGIPIDPAGAGGGGSSGGNAGGSGGASGAVRAVGRSSGRRSLLVIGAVVVVAVVIVIAAVLARGGGDDAEVATGPGPSTTRSTVTTAVRATTVPSTVPGIDDQIVGSWTADASEVLAANMANLGGAPGAMTCRGPIVLTFTAEETYDRRGSATCTMAGVTQSVDLAASGTYTLDGEVLEMSESSAVVGTEDGRVSIEGDTLEIVFTSSATGTVTQTYRRT